MEESIKAKASCDANVVTLALENIIEAKITKKTKVILPVHYSGLPCNLKRIKDIADKHNLIIIEDACHALGARYKASKIGDCKYSDMAVFSFHPVKHITTGEGGMITTNDEKLYEKLLMLRTHGITKESDKFQNSAEFAIGSSDSESSVETYPNWYMEMQTLGFNYRLTDFQAALGLSQLNRADEGLVKRKQIAQTYLNSFNGKSFLKGQSGVVEGHAYHLYIIEVEDRLGLYNHLRAHHIFAQIHYIPCHLMPYYKQFGWKEGDMPNAEKYYKHCLSLPLYPILTANEQEYVIKSICNYFE